MHWSIVCVSFSHAFSSVNVGLSAHCFTRRHRLSILMSTASQHAQHSCRCTQWCPVQTALKTSSQGAPTQHTAAKSCITITIAGFRTRFSNTGEWVQGRFPQLIETGLNSMHLPKLMQIASRAPHAAAELRPLSSIQNLNAPHPSSHGSSIVHGATACGAVAACRCMRMVGPLAPFAHVRSRKPAHEASCLTAARGDHAAGGQHPARGLSSSGATAAAASSVPGEARTQGSLFAAMGGASAKAPDGRHWVGSGLPHGVKCHQHPI